VSWNGEGGRLRGTKVLVQDAHRTSWVLVAATDGDAVSQFLVPTDSPGIRVLRRSALDLTRRMSDVVFDDVEVTAATLVGSIGEARAAVERQLDLACVLSAAESVGAMDVIFEETVEYAKARTAFGRPIGSFQAVKHLLADTVMSLEQCKALSVAATHAVDAQTSDASELASMAKAFIGEAGVSLAHNCWQAFGGIAFTWEHDFHLFLRRLTLDASLYGEATFHYERICRLNHLGED
jgi:alkylation response protein AidB-like acyl-CoA dehydrogenase